MERLTRTAGCVASPTADGLSHAALAAAMHSDPQEAFFPAELADFLMYGHVPSLAQIERIASRALRDMNGTVGDPPSSAPDGAFSWPFAMRYARLSIFGAEAQMASPHGGVALASA